MSSFFDDLEAQLRSAARARAGAPAAGRDVPRRRRRWRGWLRAGIGAVPVVASVLITLVVVGGALVLLGHRGHGTSPPTPPSGNGINALIAHTPQKQLRQELGYTLAATEGQNFKACRVKQPTRVTYIQGSPGSDLLSILGVLRRPATAADRPYPGLISGLTDVYRAYVRRAFSAGGVFYDIVPARGDGVTIPSDRCIRLQAAALRRELPKVPASLREPTRQLGAAWIAYERSLATQASRDTITLVYGNRNEGGEGGQTSRQGIEEGLATASSQNAFTGIVPDGVATVTVIFPAVHGQAPRTVTAPVRGNVYAVPVRNPSFQDLSQTVTVIWRSAQGSVLKRFSNPEAKALAALCKHNPFPCLLVRDDPLTSAGGSASSTSSTASASPPTPTQTQVQTSTSASGKP